MNSITHNLVPVECIWKEKNGEVSSETVCDLVGDAIVEDKVTLHRKFLVDLRAGNFRETVSGIYTLGPRMQDRGLIKEHKVALLCAGQTTYYEFLESVLDKRGFHNVRIFFSLSEAYEWLR
jgi:hypothetical protein